MRLELEKKPKGVKLIAGFPGFGLIGTITTEFLIEHLNAVQIGKIRVDEMPPIVAIHQGQVVEPVGIFFSKKYNLVIIHALTSVAGIEWALQNEICKLMDELKVKEVISIEGIGSQNAENINVYYLSNKKLDSKKINVSPLKEGIILGVSGALLLRRCTNLVALFVETHSTLPDSRGAAKIIEVLDRYLGLKVDYKPLLEKAVKFENKIKELMSKKEKAAVNQEKKELTYLG